MLGPRSEYLVVEQRYVAELIAGFQPLVVLQHRFEVACLGGNAHLALARIRRQAEQRDVVLRHGFKHGEQLLPRTLQLLRHTAHLCQALSLLPAGSAVLGLCDGRAAAQLQFQAMDVKLWHGLQKRFKGKIDLSQAVALNDIKQQLGNLVYPGFVRETPGVWFKELPRYLKAVELRLEKLGSQVQKDRVWSGELANLWAQYKARADKHAQEGKRDEQLTVYRWWLEEYRVSLFAQQLGTKVPISDKRLSKQWSQVEG